MILLSMSTAQVFAAESDSRVWDVKKLGYAAVGIAALFIPQISKLRKQFIRFASDNKGKDLGHMASYSFAWAEEEMNGGVKLTASEEQALIQKHKDGALKDCKDNPAKFKKTLRELAEQEYSVRNNLKDKQADFLTMLFGFNPEDVQIDVLEGQVADKDLVNAFDDLSHILNSDK